MPPPPPPAPTPPPSPPLATLPPSAFGKACLQVFWKVMESVYFSEGGCMTPSPAGLIGAPSTSNDKKKLLELQGDQH
ncbi:hypothetical protein DFH27DRAFT_617445 [Peziza echinospora]|nr:hypothetical protein DFH27DRAFT_617445 [Peziza echinospora]